MSLTSRSDSLEVSKTNSQKRDRTEASVPVLDVPENFDDASHFVHGTFYSDLYKVECCNPGLLRNARIAVKRLRFHTDEDKEMLVQELQTWHKVVHPNVLSLLGHALDSRTYPLIVTKWIDNGSVWDYLGVTPDGDSLRLITGAARGLAHIHGIGAVHSDVKSARNDNILVSDSGDALICDFGISRLVSSSESMADLSIGPTGKNTNRYLAYELLSRPSEQVNYTSKTDVWAFGMTVYEIVLRKHPFGDLDEDGICRAILDLKVPKFPAESSLYPDSIHSHAIRDSLRAICNQCWDPQPDSRIDMPSIIEGLERNLFGHGIDSCQDDAG